MLEEIDPNDYRQTAEFKTWVSEVQAFMDANPDKLFTAAKVKKEITDHPRWDIHEALRACVNVMHVPGYIEYYVGGVSVPTSWFGELDDRKPARRGRVTA